MAPDFTVEKDKFEFTIYPDIDGSDSSENFNDISFEDVDGDSFSVTFFGNP
jgi:hypothetical protein